MNEQNNESQPTPNQTQPAQTNQNKPALAGVCLVCGRWWKASAVSTHLTIWTEMPDWVIRMLWHSIWESAENHPTKERGNHE